MTTNQQDSAANRPNSVQELWENVQLAWSLFRDNRVSPYLRFGIPILIAVYVISPVDIVPDVIPGLGQLDDIAALWVGLTFFLSQVPANIKDEYRSGARSEKADRAADPDVVEGDYRVVND
jgi:uncharacterized membrane protein YkvA (DUF1232 family)